MLDEIDLLTFHKVTYVISDIIEEMQDLLEEGDPDVGALRDLFEDLVYNFNDVKASLDTE